MKRHYSILALITVVMFASLSCSKTGKKEIMTPADKAKESINTWMVSNKAEYPDYKSIEFGALTPRYQRTSRAYQLSNLMEQEKAKPTPNQGTLDSLDRLLNSNKGEFLGYTITHKYQTKTLAGEMLESENLFFLDSLFRIITILNADAYDQIMDEKLIFRQEIADTLH
ncbi:MAG: hypothetical protein AB7S54_07710 [Bacteroidales bacterium]